MSNQRDILRLNLIGNAARAAYDLLSLHPDIVFTSGRRTRREQARAMAENIVRAGGRWIQNTYKPSIAAHSCQAWINGNPDVKSVSEITQGLLFVFGSMSDVELSRLSKHLTGEAFDVSPVDGSIGLSILNSCRHVTHQYDGLFLEREGGLQRWHCQF